MSGGVDSAVTAGLLLREGFEVYGVTLRLWREASLPPTDMFESAAGVARALGIPFTIVDLQERFYHDVVEAFADAYARGRTPNPCITCNPTIKFAALIEEADRIGAEWIATGHYARIARDNERARLIRARCAARDQSYVLYRLNQSVLRRLKMPLGDYEDKAQIRELARTWDLPAMSRSDSQDLCFLSGGNYRTLLESIRPEALQPGPIYDENGRKLGEHRGLPFYTVGQREGLGIATGERLYVLRLDPEQNAVIVGSAEQLTRPECRLDSVVFTAGKPPAEHFTAGVQIRYRAAPVPAEIKLESETEARVVFAAPQRGVTPGQSLVFYEGEEALGGGFIQTG